MHEKAEFALQANENIKEVHPSMRDDSIDMMRSNKLEVIPGILDEYREKLDKIV